MRGRALRILARAAGVALIPIVVWLVGLEDRVTDKKGVEHTGHVIDHGPSSVLLRMGDRTEEIGIADARSIRLGLISTFATVGRRPAFALAGLGLHVVAILVIFLRWHLLLRGAALPTPWRAVVRMGWVGQLFGCVLPGGIAAGDVVKAVYLARLHPGREARSVVTVVADRALGLFVLCAIAALAAAFAPAGAGLGEARLTVAVLAVVAAILLLLFSSRRIRHALGLPKLVERLPFQRVLQEIGRALALYSGRPRTLVAPTAVAIAGHALILAGMACYGRALGDWLSPAAVLVAIPIASILAAIPGLPGGWGVGDAAFFVCLPALGVPPGQAVALSVTYRLAHTLIALPAGFLVGRAGPEPRNLSGSAERLPP